MEKPLIYRNGMVDALKDGMSDALFGAGAIQGLKLTLDASIYQQKAIASNLSNLNTPGYKRKEVDPAFTRAFNQALGAFRRGDEAGAIPGGSIVEAQNQGTARSDGNTTDLETEMMDLTQNSTRFDFASRMLTNNYHGIKFAITGEGAM